MNGTQRRRRRRCSLSNSKQAPISSTSFLTSPTETWQRCTRPASPGT
jgi:hypothetical protein